MKSPFAAMVTLSVLSLAACSGAGEPVANDKITLSYALWADQQLPAYQMCADAFTAKNPSITIKIQQTAWDQYWTDLTTKLAAGDAPDVFTNHLSRYPELAANNQLLPLETAGLDLSIYQKGLADLWVRDGKRYGDDDQGRWLESELADHPADCTLAIWHHPRFSTGYHGPIPELTPFWDALYDAGADLIVNGHDHDYERFAPLDPAGEPDPERGIREFVAGYIAQRIRDGAFRDVDPTLGARAFLGMVVDYLIVRQIFQQKDVYGEGHGPQQVADAFVAIFLDGIRSRDERSDV